MIANIFAQKLENEKQLVRSQFSMIVSGKLQESSNVKKGFFSTYSQYYH